MAELNPSFFRHIPGSPYQSLRKDITEALTVGYGMKQLLQKFPGADFRKGQAGFRFGKAPRLITGIEPVDHVFEFPCLYGVVVGQTRRIEESYRWLIFT